MAPWIEDKDGVVLRKVDIVDWESEAARQMVETYQVQGIPFVLVYDRKGTLLGDVRGADFETVKALVQKGL